MKIKFWITIFLLSFSLAAVAEVPLPIFRIPESKQVKLSAVRKFELYDLQPLAKDLCHKTRRSRKWK